MLKAFKSVFVSARAKSIVTMIEEIKIYHSLRWDLNRHKISKYEGNNKATCKLSMPTPSDFAPSSQVAQILPNQLVLDDFTLSS